MSAVRFRRPSWRDLLSALIVIVLVGVMLSIVGALGVRAAQNTHAIESQTAENHAQDKQIDSLVNSLADANKKLSNAGLPTVPVVVQPSNGQNGKDGADGRSVLATTCEPSGMWVVTYDDGQTAPAGQGCVGAQGAAGENGVNGQDSTIPGPQGIQGPPGADSTVPGPTGATGAAGQPPYSWTFQDAAGVSYTCNRADPFSADTPEYTCGITPPDQGETK